jgi:hypothetical protein
VVLDFLINIYRCGGSVGFSPTSLLTQSYKAIEHLKKPRIIEFHRVLVNNEIYLQISYLVDYQSQSNSSEEYYFHALTITIAAPYSVRLT